MTDHALAFAAGLGPPGDYALISLLALNGLRQLRNNFPQKLVPWPCFT